MCYLYVANCGVYLSDTIDEKYGVASLRDPDECGNMRAGELGTFAFETASEVVSYAPHVSELHVNYM